MVCNFVSNIVYLNLNSIFKILNAITTKYRDFLTIFLRFEPHFLINFFLIKKRVWSLMHAASSSSPLLAVVRRSTILKGNRH